MLGSSTSLVTFSVTSVVCTGETALSISFSFGEVKEVSSTTMSVVGLAVLSTSTIVMASIRGPVEAAPFSLAAVVMGSSVITPRVTSTAVTVVSAPVTTVVNASVVSTIGRVVVCAVVFLVNGSADTSVLDSMVTVKVSFVTFVPIFSSTGKGVSVSTVLAVVDFLVSTSCFSVVALRLSGSLTSVTIPVASVVCTGETVLAICFSNTAAVDVSSTTVAVVGLAVLGTSALVVTLV